jgi:hypothetical protein
MSSTYRKAFVVLAAVMTLGAITSSAASASQWYVGGKALAGSEKLSETVKVEDSITISIPVNKSKITCTALKASKSEIASTTLITLKGPVLQGCKLTVPSEEGACKLEGSEIFTKPLEAKMSLGQSPEDSAELTAPSKEWFVFSGGSECNAFLNESPIKGTVTLKAPKGQTEATEQEFVGQGEASKGLTWNAQPAYLTGRFKLKLASGKAWSFH